jgi:3-oxoacyl-[acyl-carrier-protein] synthase II
MSKSRVVVTGMGAISPLGHTLASTWEALVASRSGLGPITHFDATEYPARVAAEVKDYDPSTSGLDAKDVKKCDRFILLGLTAAREAMAQAGLADFKSQPESIRARAACLLGTGIGGLPATEDAYATIASRGPKRVSPFFIPAMLPNLLAGQASIMFGLLGANVCPVSACATSAHAIGWAKRLIEYGEADIVLAGGAEAAICPSSVAGFAAMRALSTNFNDTPTAASRPFDAARDGFVMGEGAAALVLESEAHARARGATILAVLSGFGQTGDAEHITLASGNGSQRAMAQALTDAGLQASDINAINAHATSTPAGDEREAATLLSMFGQTPVSATKGATGHLLGAAGALESVISIQTLRTGTLPPTLNATTPETTLDIVPNHARTGQNIRHILSNSFGFGGTNASLIFSKPA